MNLIKISMTFIVALGSFLSSAAMADGFTKSVNCEFTNLRQGVREILPNTFSMNISGDLVQNARSQSPLLSPLENAKVTIGDRQSTEHSFSNYTISLNDKSRSVFMIPSGLILQDGGFWVTVNTTSSSGVQTSSQDFVCK